jgi:hypothetical protein
LLAALPGSGGGGGVTQPANKAKATTAKHFNPMKISVQG